MAKWSRFFSVYPTELIPSETSCLLRGPDRCQKTSADANMTCSDVMSKCQNSVQQYETFFFENSREAPFLTTFWNGRVQIWISCFHHFHAPRKVARNFEQSQLRPRCASFMGCFEISRPFLFRSSRPHILCSRTHSPALQRSLRFHLPAALFCRPRRPYQPPAQELSHKQKAVIYADRHSFPSLTAYPPKKTMSTPRDLVPFYLPSSTTPNESMTPFSPPAESVSTAFVDQPAPRTWDHATGFFVPASPQTPSPLRKKTRRRPTTAPVVLPSPSRDTFAGSTFEVSSPPPASLPLPRFARAKPRVLVDNEESAALRVTLGMAA